MQQNIIKIAYFDAPSGIAGDMAVAALMDAGGLVTAELFEDLSALPVTGYHLETARVEVGGIAALRFDVIIDEPPEFHRDWATIRAMIEAAAGHGLSDGTVERALAIFEVLARVEAHVHEVELDKVHFHEVGALDSIIDIVGTAWCLDRLGIDACFCSPVPSGSGYVNTEHGRLPVPAPATAQLLRGFEVVAGDGKGELVTPTGAAILAAMAKPVRPGMRLQKLGTGAGTMRLDDRPNLLRVMLGEADTVDEESVMAVEADIDDMTPEALAFATEKLRAAGARDVSIVPVAMKKNRLGMRLSVLCDLGSLDTIAGCVLQETSTIGVRYRQMNRIVLPRTSEVVATGFGPITLKVVVRPDGSETAEPEFDDIAAAARKHQVPLAEVRAAALAAKRESR